VVLAVVAHLLQLLVQQYIMLVAEVDAHLLEVLLVLVVMAAAVMVA
jgi:hypothetical protein